MQHRNCLAVDPKLAAVNPHSAVELLALSAGPCLIVRVTALQGCASSPAIGEAHAIQYSNNIIIINVFEDELTDAPGPLDFQRGSGASLLGKPIYCRLCLSSLYTVC